MNDTILRIVSAVICALFFCAGTLKMLGAIQQSGYKNKLFLRWLKREENVYYGRLCVWMLCLMLPTAITALCFSFLGAPFALVVSSAPFFAVALGFVFADWKYALKVSLQVTNRIRRLLAVYLLITACVCYAWISFLYFLSVLNGSKLYALIAYVPFALVPLALPLLLCIANAITSVFENARNRKFVKRAGQVLDETKIIRIGIVGSYEKTSIKNILKTILSEKYEVVATPESYNTPIGIAKTVAGEDFSKNQIFIAEMGARKAGDIAELCALVKPDYAVFTGVCEQHIETFGSVENVFAEKSEILRCGAKVVCAESLKPFVSEGKNVLFANGDYIKEKTLSATETKFTLLLDGEAVAVSTELLGESAVENVLLAVTLAHEMGMAAEEIGRGIAKIKSIPHRLQLLRTGDAYVLDDGYNSNVRGAKESLAALARFSGKKCVVTPGIVECGILEEKINQELGAQIAQIVPDLVILVGSTLVGAVKTGYQNAQGDMEKLCVVKTLQAAQEKLVGWADAGDCVLFLNDLPDVY